MNLDAFVSGPPVLANFGHAFGVPDGTGIAEDVHAVGVNGFVLRGAMVGGGIDDRLAAELVPARMDHADRQSAVRLDAGQSFGCHLAKIRFGPAIQVVDDVHVDHSPMGTPPVAGNETEHGFEAIQQLPRFFSREIGHQLKVAGLVHLRTGCRGDSALALAGRPWLGEEHPGAEEQAQRHHQMAEERA